MATRFRTEDLRAAVVAGAERELTEAAGTGGVVSRREQAGLASGPRAAVEAVRTEKGPGARVTTSEATAAYDAAVGAAFAAVNTQGPAWLSAAETRAIADADLQGRVWNVRAQLGGGLSDAQLESRMTLHVLKNVEPSPFQRTDKVYPAVAGGQEGASAHRVTGERAEALAELATLWNAKLAAGGPAPFPGFDPATTELLAVHTTHYDNEVLRVSAVDRATGKAGAPFALELGQVTYFIDQPDFTRLVGSLASFGTTEYSPWTIDHRAVIDRLLEGTQPLDIGNPYTSFSPAQAAALTTQAQAAVISAGLTGLTLELSPPVIAAQEALPGNQLTHAQALTAALQAFRTSTVDGSSPRSLVRQAMLDELGTATLTPAQEAEVTTRLRDLLRQPSTRLRALDLDEEPEGGPGTAAPLGHPAHHPLALGPRALGRHRSLGRAAAVADQLQLTPRYHSGCGDVVQAWCRRGVR
jgi:hypothetical protein